MKDDVFIKLLFLIIVGIVLFFISYFIYNCCVFIETYENEVLNGVHTYDYFKEHLEEYEILESSIGYTKFGNPTFIVYTKHIPSEMYYEFKVSYDNYMRLNKLISGDKG